MIFTIHRFLILRQIASGFWKLETRASLLIFVGRDSENKITSCRNQLMQSFSLFFLSKYLLVDNEVLYLPNGTLVNPGTPCPGNWNGRRLIEITFLEVGWTGCRPACETFICGMTGRWPVRPVNSEQNTQVVPRGELGSLSFNWCCFTTNGRLNVDEN